MSLPIPPRPWRHVDGPVELGYIAPNFPHVLDATGKPVAFVSWDMAEGHDPAVLARLVAAAPDAIATCVALVKAAKSAACDWCVVESVLGSGQLPTHEDTCPVSMARATLRKAGLTVRS